MSDSNRREVFPSFISVEDFSHLQFFGLCYLPSLDTNGVQVGTEGARTSQRWSREEAFLKSKVRSPYDTEMLSEFFNNLRSLESFSSDANRIVLPDEESDDITDLMIEIIVKIKRHFEESNHYVGTRLSHILHQAFDA